MLDQMRVTEADRSHDLAWAAGCLSAAALLAFAVWSCVDSRHCEAIEFVRIEIGDHRYRIPVRLRPTFEGGNGRLPSYSVRDESGRWAYCQKSSEKAVMVQYLALNGPEFTAEMSKRPDLKGVTFLSVGKPYVSYYREPQSKWPRSEVAGLRVVRTKGTTDIIGSDSQFHASCSAYNDGTNIDSCRIYLSQFDGASVMFDVSKPVPTSSLRDYVASIRAYVKTLREVG